MQEPIDEKKLNDGQSSDTKEKDKEKFIDKEQLTKTVTDIISDEKVEMVLYVILKDFTVRKLDMDGKDLEVLTNDFVDEVKVKFISAEFEVKKYSETDSRRGCYYMYDLGTEMDNPYLAAINSITGNESADGDKKILYNTEKNPISEVKALVAILHGNEKYIKVCKVITGVEKMAMNKRHFYMIKDNTRFEKADGEMLNISPTFSLAQVNGFFVSIDTDKVENGFGLTDVIQRRALNTVDSIEKKKLFKDFEKIKNYIKSDNGLAKRSISVFSHSPVLQKGISNEQIIDFAKKKESKLGKLSIDNERSQFSPANKTEFKLVMKILNDDFLKSELTDEEYDILAKDKLVDKPDAKGVDNVEAD